MCEEGYTLSGRAQEILSLLSYSAGILQPAMALNRTVTGRNARNIEECSVLNIREWIDLLAQLYDQYGYILVFLGSLGENTALLGLVLPGSTLALLGAVYARLGTLNLGWVIFFAWLGTVLAYHADYLFGRFVLTSAARPSPKPRLGRLHRSAPPHR